MHETFHKLASHISAMMGSAWAFIGAIVLILVWGISGPLFRFSDGWQLVINTGTTIITFLMVFLIQNTQNRDAKAMHLKLDELLRAGADARNSLINLEDLTDEQLKQLREQFAHLQAQEADEPRADPESERPPRKRTRRSA